MSSSYDRLKTCQILAFCASGPFLKSAKIYMQLFYFPDLVVTPSCSMLAVNTPLHFASYYGHPLEVN